MSIYPNKSPVRVQYNFTIDLDIKEEQIPFVKTSLLINDSLEEPYEFKLINNVDGQSDNDIWYLYGDEDLIYVGSRIIAPTGHANLNNGYYYAGSARESASWRCKYYTYSELYNRIYPEWTTLAHFLEYSIKWVTRNEWKDIEDNSIYRLLLPYHTSYYQKVPAGHSAPSPLYSLPYNTITVKRNTGESVLNVQNMNPVYNSPIDYTYPNMQHLEGENGSLNYQSLRTNKLWIKIGENKYKLKIWGEVFKFTDTITIENIEYPVWNCTYIPKYYWEFSHGDEDWWWYRYWSRYELQSSSIDTVTKPRYGGQATQSDLTLSVNYINDKGSHEVRKYKK